MGEGRGALVGEVVNGVGAPALPSHRWSEELGLACSPLRAAQRQNNWERALVNPPHKQGLGNCNLQREGAAGLPPQAQHLSMAPISHLQHPVFLAGWLQPQEGDRRHWGGQQTGGGGWRPDLCFPAPAGQRGPSSPLAPIWPGDDTPGLVDDCSTGVWTSPGWL